MQFTLRVSAQTCIKPHWNEMESHFNDLSDTPPYICPKGSCIFTGMQRKLFWQPSCQTTTVTSRLAYRCKTAITILVSFHDFK